MRFEAARQDKALKEGKNKLEKFFQVKMVEEKVITLNDYLKKAQNENLYNIKLQYFFYFLLLSHYYLKKNYWTGDYILKKTIAG